MEIKEIIEELESKGLRYIIFNTENTWFSQGINPITHEIEELHDL